MLRRLTLSIIFLVSLGIAAPSIPVLNIALGPIIGVEQAQAQQKKKRKTLFDVLFKRRKKKTKVKVKKPPRKATSIKAVKKKTTKRKTKRTTRAAAAVTKPAVIAVKNENAAKILVVGDFLAGGMGRELEKLYASNPNVVVVNKTDPSSGIVRDDVINWPEYIPTLIDEFKPEAIVALLGMNDRQKLWTVEGKPDKLSEAWLAEYNNRVSKIASIGFSQKIPLVWVGLPPVRSGRMNADYLVFNEIYRTKVAAVGGGEYVDIWDGFTNEEGKFVSAGPDINGQIVRLRGSKGINMTRAGRAKLAFFADKALQKIGVIGNPDGFNYASLGTINPGIAQPNVPEYDPIGTGKTVVIPLGSPALDGGDILEGEKNIVSASENETSDSYRLVQKGEVNLPKAGRIDAAWGKPKADAPIIQPVEAKDEKKSDAIDISKRLSPKPTVTNIQPSTATQ
jgi:hypothetical protein